MTFSRLGEVLAEVEPLGTLFSDAGYRLFLVGGIVRDQMLDKPLDAASDIDLTTNALPAQIKKIVAPFADDLWTQGEKFGTIGLRAGGRDYEITTHRAESYTSDSRKPEVSFGDDIEVDLSRRDFTVNAMAIELPDGDLVDPNGGANDLEAGVLRTPLSAEISFTDDPLRMLRAARFATKYSLTPAPDLTKAAVEFHERLRIVAIERIGVELRRLLELDSALTGLEFLRDTGLLAEVLAYGDQSLVSTVESRLDRAVQLADSTPADWQLRLAAIGLAVFDDRDGVQAMCRRLRLSRDDERAVSGIARSVLGVIDADDLSAPTIRRWIVSNSRRDPHRLDIAPVALAYQLQGTGETGPFMDALEALTASEDVDDVTFLDGGAVMDLLGIAPGPAIGQAHAFLQERYFEQGPLDEAEQRDLLRSWWADQATNS